ncbi:MAG: zinc finger BED domain-containing protein [Clostridia bacterium]|nr:zinc finger BED domain-containing protein [Clostridia bacterium]
MRTIGLIVKQPPEFTCPICGNKYATEGNLNKHLKEKHPEYKPDSGNGGGDA